MSGRLNWRDRPGPFLVGAYIFAMPLLAGLPRGALVPLVRPSEVLQLVVTAAGLGLVAVAIMSGRRWNLQLLTVEWWLLGMVVASSFLPLVWLAARGLPIGSTDVVSAMPFIKYAALYFLARAAIRTESDAELVIWFALAGAIAITVIALLQAIGVTPVTDVLARWFVSSASQLTDDGRATTTIGSSIATGSYLTIACGLALAYAFGSGRRVAMLAAVLLGVGAFASGQVGSVISLVIVVLGVAVTYRRLGRVIAVAIPAAAVAIVALWSVVIARLADIHPESGLPTSWLIRWANVTELYWPTLADGGWVLGVRPNAVIVPPDVWRERVFLESGYLWLLWVGGIPLLLAALGFLISAWRDLGAQPMVTGSPISAARAAASAAILMIGVMSLLDPHMTLRAESDLFFVQLAAGLAAVPIVVGYRLPHRLWHDLLGWDQAHARGISWSPSRARLQIAEAPDDEDLLDGDLGELVESRLSLIVRADEQEVGRTTLTLCRAGSDLHGVVAQPVSTQDPEARALIWRAVVLCANSLRLTTLRAGPSIRADRSELRLAGRVASRAEKGRVQNIAPPITSGGRIDRDGGSRPPVRIVADISRPRWKRGLDLIVGTVGLIVSAPFWVACAIWIRLTSPGPILFRQVRVGAGGLPFQLYKFRTMFVDNDDSAHRESNRLELLEGADAAKLSNDSRVTPAGRWLRKLSLDELPQLLNVLRSEMSLVGPRPSLLWEVEMIDPVNRRRLSVHPGLTGLWQVSGRADVSMTGMLDLDLQYVDTMSPTVDLQCLAGTASAVLTGKGAR